MSLVMMHWKILLLILPAVQGMLLTTKRGKCQYQVTVGRNGFSKLRYSSSAQEECAWQLAVLNNEQVLVMSLRQIDMRNNENGIFTCTGEVSLPGLKDTSGCVHPLQTKAYILTNSFCTLSDVLTNIKPPRSEILVGMDKSVSKVVKIKSVSQKRKSFVIEYKIMHCLREDAHGEANVSLSHIAERADPQRSSINARTVYIVVICVLVVVVVILCIAVVVLYKRRSEVSAAQQHGNQNDGSDAHRTNQQQLIDGENLHAKSGKSSSPESQN